MSLARPCLPMLLLLVMMPSAAQAQTPLRPTVTLDPASGQIVGVGRLSSTPGCASASGTGRVVKRHVERGALRGITFKDDKYGEGFVNVEDTRQIRDPALRRQVEDGLTRLLAVGSEVAVDTLGCGAAGRVEELVSVKLKRGAAPVAAATPPSSGSLTLTKVGEPPAAVPTKWLLTNPTKVQSSLAIASADRKFGFSLSCMNTRSGGLHFSSYFEGPRNWSAQTSGPAVTIDGAKLTWELDGADEGYSVSDSLVNNMTTLSAGARIALAKGQRLVIDGKMDRGGARGATFDISGGEAIFARFEEKCRALPAA